MPHDINIPLVVGSDRTSAIQTIGVSNDIAFGFERSSIIFQSGVKQRSHILAFKRRSFGAFAHSVPSHMYSSVFPNSQLRTANRTCSHGAAGLTVDRNGL